MYFAATSLQTLPPLMCSLLLMALTPRLLILGRQEQRRLGADMQKSLKE